MIPLAYVLLPPILNGLPQGSLLAYVWPIHAIRVVPTPARAVFPLPVVEKWLIHVLRV